MSKAAELAALIANVNKGSSLAAKNFIINGAQNVAQRGTSSTGIGASSGYFTTDRMQIVSENTAGRLTMEQVADGPDGFANCTKLTCTTADTSIASNEALILNQNIEGQNLQSLKKGTSDAVPVTVSFYVKANASATYTIELKSGDGGTNRMNSHEFSVTTGWTRITKTFVGDTSQALDDDNNTSIQFNLWLHAGSDYTGGTHTDNVWHTTNNQRVGDSQTSFFDSTSRTFFITGIQMELGEKATEFETEPFETTLRKCQRYYTKYQAGSAYSYLGSGQASSATTARIVFQFPTEMNHAPALEQSANNTMNVYATDSEAFSADAAINHPSTHSSAITCTVSSGLTAKAGASVVANNSTSAYLAFESEL
jgi:hypothetical protein|tara:strand:+ start:1270 stop:2373 length:1104 start_codon:yes stop_codon:yes gene_type:complete